MKSLYEKITIKQAWNMVKGFYAALGAMYEIFKVNNEKLLQYPLIDLAFHTMEKTAFVLLTVKKGSYTGKHTGIRNDFIKEFSTFSVFKEMVEKYPKIMNAKDSLMYEFENLLPKELICSYIDCVKNFKEQAGIYLASKRVRL